MFIITIGISQEMNVDGNLTVTGTINASDNKITNVADPTEDNDAVNMRTLSSSSLKPTRIYRLQVADETVYTTPSDRFWKLIINYNGNGYENTMWPKIIVNNILYDLWYHRSSGGYSTDTKEYWLLPNDTFYCSKDHSDQEYHITIFEYTFTSSGIDQGMDYIEP